MSGEQAFEAVDDCIHGLGHPDWCVVCNGRVRAEELAAAARREAVKVPFWLFRKDVAPLRKGSLGDTLGGDERMYERLFASRWKDRARQDWDD